MNRRTTRRGTIPIVLAAAVCAFGLRAERIDLPADAAVAAEAIDESTLRAHVRFLSDDLLEGRGPSSRGDELAQLYLATEMESMGLEPGASDGSWYQSFDIVGVDSHVPAHWTFQGRNGELTLEWWNEFIASSGVQAESSGVSDAELVFVGYGIDAPEYGWDDYKGMDVTGKILVMMNNDPDWDPAIFEGNRRLYYGRWDYKYEIAAAKGAAGAIIIHTTPSAGYPFQVVQTSWTGEQFHLPAGSEPRCQLHGWVTEDAARRLVALAGKDLDKLRNAARNRNFRPVPLGVTTSLTMKNDVARKRTGNVLGLLPGSDPELKDEVVIFTAHHDHLGTGQPDSTGDTIYNGALDNASGSSQLLAIARSFTRLAEPPRRSILFVFVAGEEQGLLGSAHYAANPTFHPGKIAANINIDGGNIWGRTRDLTYIGYGKSTLDAYVEELARRQGRTVQGDQFPDRGFFYRSDQFSLAKIGVPAFYYDGGTDFIGRPAGWGKEQIESWEAIHYHQPGDELEAGWSFEGMIEDARLAFLTGLAVAEADQMPSWKPGDEFEAARKKALDEAGR